MKWISVKDKLPDGIEILAYVVVSNGPDRIRIAERYEDGWKIIGGVSMQGRTDFYDLSSMEISHWMPLPEKPE